MKPHSSLLKYAIFGLAGAAMFYACNPSQKTETTYAVTPPVEGVDILPKEYVIDAAQGGEIKTETGSRVSIPAGSFTDADGKAVSGEVKISFREFHDAAGIIASGIPMTIMENGKKQTLESAGMFEIEGTDAQGKPVFVAEGKKLQVDLASFVSGDDFNFYVLNTEKKSDLAYRGEGQKMQAFFFDGGDDDKKIEKKVPRGWQMLAAKVKPAKNKKKEEALIALKKKAPKPIQPEKHDNKKFTFNFKVNLSKFPELKKLKGVMWQYAGNGGKDDPESKENEWIFTTNWEDVSLEPGGGDLYVMKLKAKDKNFQSVVKPALNGRNFEKAMQKFNEKMSAYNETLDERKALEAEADLVRSFGVNKFGIYNWDRVHDYDAGAVLVKANFQTDGDKSLEKATIFHITGTTGTAVVKYPKSDWDLFRYSTTEQNKLVAILPGKEIAVFKQEDFDRLSHDEIKNKNFTFRLQNSGTVQQTEDLMEIIRNM